MLPVKNLMRALGLVARFAIDNKPIGLLHVKARRQVEAIMAEAGVARPDLPHVLFLKFRWYTMSSFWFLRMLGPLYGLKITRSNHRHFACISMIMAINDYAVDDTEGNHQLLLDMIERPETLDGKEPVMRLFQHMMDLLRAELPDEQYQLMRHYLLVEWHTQIETRHQLDDAIPDAEVLKLTRDKSGWLLLLYRSLLNVPFKVGEEKALYETGAITQFTNDIIDLYKDAHKGVRTSATICTSLQQMQEQVQHQAGEAFIYLKKLNYDKRELEKFVFTFYGFYVGLLTYIHHYNKVTQGQYSLGNYMATEKKVAKPNPISLLNLLYGWKFTRRFNYEALNQAKDLPVVNF